MVLKAIACSEIGKINSVENSTYAVTVYLYTYTSARTVDKDDVKCHWYDDLQYVVSHWSDSKEVAYKKGKAI